MRTMSVVSYFVLKLLLNCQFFHGYHSRKLIIVMHLRWATVILSNCNHNHVVAIPVNIYNIIIGIPLCYIAPNKSMMSK